MVLHMYMISPGAPKGGWLLTTKGKVGHRLEGRGGGDPRRCFDCDGIVSGKCTNANNWKKPRNKTTIKKNVKEFFDKVNKGGKTERSNPCNQSGGKELSINPVNGTTPGFNFTPLAALKSNGPNAYTWMTCLLFKQNLTSGAQSATSGVRPNFTRRQLVTTVGI